jgi:hypothetical protein
VLDAPIINYYEPDSIPSLSASALIEAQGEGSSAKMRQGATVLLYSALDPHIYSKLALAPPGPREADAYFAPVANNYNNFLFAGDIAATILANRKHGKSLRRVSLTQEAVLVLLTAFLFGWLATLYFALPLILLTALLWFAAAFLLLHFGIFAPGYTFVSRILPVLAIGSAAALVARVRR